MGINQGLKCSENLETFVDLDENTISETVWHSIRNKDAVLISKTWYSEKNKKDCYVSKLSQIQYSKILHTKICFLCISYAENVCRVLVQQNSSFLKEINSYVCMALQGMCSATGNVLTSRYDRWHHNDVLEVNIDTHKAY
jgi:hypothetical protein